MKQFDVEAGALVKDYGMIHHGSIWTIIITNDKNFAYTTDQSGVLKQWDLKLKTLWKDWGSIHKNAINCMRLTADDKILFTCDDDGILKQWSLDLINLDLEKDDFTQEGTPILALTTSHDNQYLYYGDDNGSLFKWEIGSQILITSALGMHELGIFSLTVTNDDQYFFL